ncbi:MAG: NUDIX domain-containing protein [Thermosynechococcaceae cyanobacterium]
MNLPTVIEAAIAILHQDGRFLLQLRDDIPTIVYPNQWACFGGHMNPGEAPEAAVRRELIEEIGYTATAINFFKRDDGPGVQRYVFSCPLEVDITDLTLNEGWDLGLFTPAEIVTGICHAPRDQQPRSIAIPHQQVLLDFYQNTLKQAD